MDEEISNLINAITKRTDLSEPQKTMMITEIIQNEINKLGKRGLEEVAKMSFRNECKNDKPASVYKY